MRAFFGMGKSGAHWEHFAHEADVGVRGIGPTREAAFEQAALALMHAIGDPARIEPRELVKIACDAPDDALLFVDWLNALIFEVATRGMLFARFEVRIDGRRLRGRAWGEPIDPARHELAVEAKGATYTDLAVVPAPGRRLARAVRGRRLSADGRTRGGEGWTPHS